MRKEVSRSKFVDEPHDAIATVLKNLVTLEIHASSGTPLISPTVTPSPSLKMYAASLLSTLLAAPLALAAPPIYQHISLRAPVNNIKCPIVIDGRVPTNLSKKPTLFDTSNALFNPDYVKGNNLAWSQILKFPATEASRFDGADFTAVEVTISDASIFQKQYGFRRAGLQFASDSSQDSSDEGIKTLHFSVKQDPARPLNLTHEYLNVWHEAADYSNNQIQFQTGTLIDSPSSKKNNFKILDRAGKQIWEIPINYKKWQNFAIKLDYTKKYVVLSIYQVFDRILTSTAKLQFTTPPALQNSPVLPALRASILLEAASSRSVC